jgi:hypothetical protein
LIIASLFLKFFFLLEFEVYLKSKIAKLTEFDTDNLDCKSPDYHERYSAKSIDESKASVYFTPTDGCLSPQPMQLSPIHINYINDNVEAAQLDEARGGFWRPLRNQSRSNNHLPATNRNSFQLPSDYLDETDETLMGNFIVPDPIYCDIPKEEQFQDITETSSMNVGSSTISLSSTTNARNSSRRKKKKYRDEQPMSTLSVENEAFLMEELNNVADVTKGARPKVYHYYNRKDPRSKIADDSIANETSSSSSGDVIKKVNSQVSLDEKTGKVVSTSSPTSDDNELATNIDCVNCDKIMSSKLLKLQTSSSLPDLPHSDSGTKSSSTTTLSSNINNQSQMSSVNGNGHGKLVVLALENEKFNQIDVANDTIEAIDHHQISKKKIKLNIDPTSSSSASSVNLDFNGDMIVTEISTL